MPPWVYLYMHQGTAFRGFLLLCRRSPGDVTLSPAKHRYDRVGGARPNRETKPQGLSHHDIAPWPETPNS